MSLAGGGPVSVSCRIAVALVCLHQPAALAQHGKGHAGPAPVTFYDTVLPLLQKHCLSCHSPGGIGRMPLATYEEVRTRLDAVRESVTSRRMPPWAADPNFGHFLNDPRLSEEDIRLIDSWARSDAPPGRPPKHRSSIPVSDAGQVSADMVLMAPNPVSAPANQPAACEYLVFSLPFTHDRWVQAVELRRAAASAVRHAILYIREPQSEWLRNVAPGVPYAPLNADAIARAANTTAEILSVFTPAAPSVVWPDGVAKKIPAGSDLVLEIHYSSKATGVREQPGIGLAFARERPNRRIVTLTMRNGEPAIPAGDVKHMASVWGTLAADALLVGVFPQMCTGATAFDFEVVTPGAAAETLLKVKPYNSSTELNYMFKNPRLLSSGTLLRCTGGFDTAARNPDSTTGIETSLDAIMAGFVDIAVDVNYDKHTLFRSSDKKAAVARVP